MAASARGRTPLGAGRDLNDRGGRVAVLCPAKAARRASQLLAWPSPWAKEGLLGGLRLDRAKLPVGSGAHSGGSHCQFTFLQKRSIVPLFFGRGCGVLDSGCSHNAAFAGAVGHSAATDLGAGRGGVLEFGFEYTANLTACVE